MLTVSLIINFTFLVVIAITVYRWYIARQIIKNSKYK